MTGRDPTTDPVRWVDDHGDALYRFALARVGRGDVAEDLVQETFLAALRAADRFAGQSAERTWLVGILRHKIIDHFRATVTISGDDPDPWVRGLFDRTGHLRDKPGAWGSNPSELLENAEFWQAFRDCLTGLADPYRQALTLRVLDGVPSADVCQALGITPTNLWTILYRARMRLWECLNRKGLSPTAES